jgi:putative ABC transport system permease protein
MTSALPVQTLGIFVAAIMAIGSCFAAMNTMYTAVARRNREIGVLQMLGFSRWSILVSFVAESLLISLLGGIIGCLLVLPLNGVNTRMGNFVTFSETTFQFEVTPIIMAIGIAFAAFMGVLGGVLPARMAARKEVLASLRDL